MVLTLPHRKRPFHEFMPLWKEHAASPRESRLASFNFHRQREEEEEEAKGTEFYDQPRRGPLSLRSLQRAGIFSSLELESTLSLPLNKS